MLSAQANQRRYTLGSILQFAPLRITTAHGTSAKHSHHSPSRSIGQSYLFKPGVKTQTALFLQQSYILPVDLCTSHGTPRGNFLTTVFEQRIFKTEK